MLPDAADEDIILDLIDIDLFTDLSLEGVTSGADSALWGEEESAEDEDQAADDSEVTSDEAEGVTSGNDGAVDGDVKTSRRKHKQPE